MPTGVENLLMLVVNYLIFQTKFRFRFVEQQTAQYNKMYSLRRNTKEIIHRTSRDFQAARNYFCPIFVSRQHKYDCMKCTLVLSASFPVPVLVLMSFGIWKPGFRASRLQRMNISRCRRHLRRDAIGWCVFIVCGALWCWHLHRSNVNDGLQLTKVNCTKLLLVINYSAYLKVFCVQVLFNVVHSTSV